MTLDNSTGVPQYKYIEVEGYETLKSKRGAVADWRFLWPIGIVYFEIAIDFTGKLLDAMLYVIC